MTVVEQREVLEPIRWSSRPVGTAELVAAYEAVATAAALWGHPSGVGLYRRQRKIAARSP